jgi:hypothetical protein
MFWMRLVIRSSCRVLQRTNQEKVIDRLARYFFTATNKCQARLMRRQRLSMPMGAFMLPAQEEAPPLEPTQLTQG